MFNSGFTLLRDDNYRVFSIGQGISWLGSVMQSVAQGWLLWSLTKSPAQLALAAIMLSLPVLLFSVPGGVAADRFEKRALLVITQTGSLIPPLFLGILALRGEATAPAMMFLALCQGGLNAFEVPARQALLAELVPKECLGQAVALNAVSFNATRLFGPAAAGCIIAAFGAAPCFFFNALTCLMAVFTLVQVRLPNREPDHPLRPQGLAAAGLHEGLRFAASSKEVRQLLLSVLLVSLFAIPFVPLLPVFAEMLRRGPQGLGFMSACLGSGSLLAALALAFRDHLPHPHSDGGGAGVLFALALLLFSRCTDYALSLAALAVAGGAVAVFLAGVNRSLQQACPDRLRGRVMGVYTLILLGMAPVGSALMGGVAAKLGASCALTLTSALCVAGLALLQVRSRRQAAVTNSGDSLWSGKLTGNEVVAVGKGAIRRSL